MTITTSKEQAIALLERAGQEKSKNYVYPGAGAGAGAGCFYVRDGRPSCIVGHVISYVAPQLLPAISDWENSTGGNFYEEEDLYALQRDLGLSRRVADTTFDFLVAALVKDGVLAFTDDALEVLREAQAVQDSGCPWGEALDAARGV